MKQYKTLDPDIEPEALSEEEELELLRAEETEIENRYQQNKEEN
jgi:hypothetical protein